MSRPALLDLPALETQLLALIRERLLEIPADFGVGDNLYDAGLDSMAIMQLLLMIEEKFGVLLPDADISNENFRDIRHLAALIHLRLASV